MQSKKISNGVFIHNLTDTKFKNMRISLNFIVPLEKEKVSANAIITSLLSQSTKDHPTISELAKHLAGLYGASFISSVSSAGDKQILSVVVSGIADKFALENENLSEIFTRLLCESVFSPLLDSSGEFVKENFLQEKRQIAESIEAEINDKIAYAKNKCREEMFKGQPASIAKYGSLETLNNTKRESLTDLLKELIEKSRIEIFVLGDANYDACEKIVASYFGCDRMVFASEDNTSIDKREAVEIVEEMNIAQSKLVMGFAVPFEDEEKYSARLMSLILGGSASSKLFLNVREKRSLCYYCSAGLDERKKAMLIQSGVETENIDIAREAIMQEIEDMKNAKISDEELEFAKIYLCNSYKSIDDSLSYKESWYLSRAMEEQFVTPLEVIGKIKAVTKEQIIAIVNKISLDTVFTLKGVTNNGDN